MSEKSNFQDLNNWKTETDYINSCFLNMIYVAQCFISSILGPVLKYWKCDFSFNIKIYYSYTLYTIDILIIIFETDQMELVGHIAIPRAHSSRSIHCVLSEGSSIWPAGHKQGSSTPFVHS